MRGLKTEPASMRGLHLVPCEQVTPGPTLGAPDTVATVHGSAPWGGIPCPAVLRRGRATAFVDPRPGGAGPL
ncbi:hypothetical protein BJQ90_03913 [Arthrobacter sp. SO3]|nr:hypothetical protein [Arthrobacter sp. SO3]